MVVTWQFWLKNLAQGNGASFSKKLKVIFADNGINCIFIGLYDMQFLKNSFLTQEVKFKSM